MKQINTIILLVLSFTFIGCGENGNDTIIDKENNDPLSQLLNLNNQEEKEK